MGGDRWRSPPRLPKTGMCSTNATGLFFISLIFTFGCSSIDSTTFGYIESKFNSLSKNGYAVYDLSANGSIIISGRYGFTQFPCERPNLCSTITIEFRDEIFYSAYYSNIEYDQGTDWYQTVPGSTANAHIDEFGVAVGSFDFVMVERDSGDTLRVTAGSFRATNTSWPPALD